PGLLELKGDFPLLPQDKLAHVLSADAGKQRLFLILFRIGSARSGINQPQPRQHEDGNSRGKPALHALLLLHQITPPVTRKMTGKSTTVPRNIARASPAGTYVWRRGRSTGRMVTLASSPCSHPTAFRTKSRFPCREKVLRANMAELPITTARGAEASSSFPSPSFAVTA